MVEDMAALAQGWDPVQRWHEGTPKPNWAGVIRVPGFEKKNLYAQKWAADIGLDGMAHSKGANLMQHIHRCTSSSI
ncbi:hypothetical protein PS1_027851 [Malus domestica]